MNKKQGYLIIFVAVILSLLLNIFFGRYLAAKVSTWPLLNRWKLISPQTPIVINTKEEVRVSDSGEIDQAFGIAKSKISLVVSNAGGQMSVLGGAVNLTSDGYFVSSKSVVDGQKPQNLFVKTDGGTVGQVSAITRDAVTGLVILKTNLNNVPVADFADSKNLAAGQRVILLGAGSLNFQYVFEATFISQAEQAGFDARDADAPNATFKIQPISSIAAGQAVADASGQIDGFWDGNAVVASNAIKNLFSAFLDNQQAIVRPAYGFHYRVVPPAEASVLAAAPGVKIISVSAGGSAQKAGLLEDDIIQSWNGTDLTAGASLEELLEASKPGDIINLQLLRGKNQINAKMVAGTSK